MKKSVEILMQFFIGVLFLFLVISIAFFNNRDITGKITVAGLMNNSNKTELLTLNFDEGNGTRTQDQTSNRNVIINNAKWVNGLTSGKALEFSGGVSTGRYSYVNAGSLNINDGFTIKATIKLNSVTGTQVIADNNYNYALWLENGIPVCGVFDRTRGMLSVKSNKLLETNKVLDLTCGYDHKNGKLKIYIDNTEQVSKNVKINKWVRGGNLIIGNGYRNGYLTGQFQGIIDNIKIENKVFAPQQEEINFLATRITTKVTHLKDLPACNEGFVPMQIINSYQSACKSKSPDKTLESFSKWAEGLMCLSPGQMEDLDKEFAKYISKLNNEDAACTVNLALPVIELTPRHSLPDSFGEFEKRFKSENNYQEMKKAFPNEIGLLFVDYENVELERFTHDCKLKDEKLECQPVFDRMKNAFERVNLGADNCDYIETAMDEFMCNKGLMCGITERLERETGKSDLGTSDFLRTSADYIGKDNFGISVSSLKDKILNSGLSANNVAKELCAAGQDAIDEDIENEGLSGILSGHDQAERCGLFDSDNGVKAKLKGELEDQNEFFACWEKNPEFDGDSVNLMMTRRGDEQCMRANGEVEVVYPKNDFVLWFILGKTIKKGQEEIKKMKQEIESSKRDWENNLKGFEDAIKDDKENKRGEAAENAAREAWRAYFEESDPDKKTKKYNEAKWADHVVEIWSTMQERYEAAKKTYEDWLKRANERIKESEETLNDLIEEHQELEKKIEEGNEDRGDDPIQKPDHTTNPGPEGASAPCSASEQRAIARLQCIAEKHIGNVQVPTEVLIGRPGSLPVPVETTRPVDNPDAPTSCASAAINKHPSNVNKYLKNQCEEKAECVEGEDCCGTLFGGITKFPPEQRAEPDPQPPWS